MKVLLVNGSPKARGCTNRALEEIRGELQRHDVDSQLFHLGNAPIRDCIGCNKCKDNACIFDDDCVNRLLEAAKEADGFIFGTPVYFSHPSGRILSVLDRAFSAGGSLFRHKPGAMVCSARRGGTTATMDVLNKHFTLEQMPVVSSSYWNAVHGNTPEEVEQDLEGLLVMRHLAANMAWLLKCIALGREHGISAPPNKKDIHTNFIR